MYLFGVLWFYSFSVLENIVNNSSTTVRPSLLATLNTIALGASAVGREISWDLSSNGRAIFVWDTLPESVDDSPIFVADNTAESVECLARAFSHYL